MEFDVVALVVASAAAGGWSALTTVQLRRLTNSHARLEKKLDRVLSGMAALGPPFDQVVYGSDRDSGRLLDADAGGVFGTRPAV